MLLGAVYLLIVGGGGWSVDHWLLRRSLKTGGEHMFKDLDRRRVLSVLGAAALLPAVGSARAAEQEGEKVEAIEDLMREHGVLRRALLVYAEAASRLARGQGDQVPTSALRDTASLFRSFGEDYHERSLEEKHVFPVLLKTGGSNATLANVLKQQHDRGREITDYISAIASRGRLAGADAKSFSDLLSSFVRMYEHHAAIEDTVIFPAWKAAIPKAQYQELSEQFEELEHRMFGKDGFDDAVERIARIEQAFGLGDLSRLTAPPPPEPA
jgi:hemerythrin-like domain-containing protein